MIKALAALLMLIDHVGAILFPQSFVLRMIGRLSMPLFAYCIARGFYYTRQKGTVAKYACNLAVFTVVSQLPYGLMHRGSFSLNIGFTWLLALLLLILVEQGPSAGPAPQTADFPFIAYIARFLCVITVMTFLAVAMPVDYGWYGVVFPAVFYVTMFRRSCPIGAFFGMAVLCVLYVYFGGSQLQIFSLAAFPVLLLTRRYDDKIKLPRKFFYWFYPVHIAVLLALKGVFSLCV